MTIEKVLNKWPLSIGAYLKGSGILHKPNILSDTKLYTHSSYFSTLERQIRVMTVQDLKVYIAFLLIDRHAQWLGIGFMKQSMGQQERCLDTVEAYIPDLMGEYYYQKAFDTDRKRNVLEMIHLIQESMKKRLSQSRWLHEKTRDEAITKLDKVLIQIGKSSLPKTYPSRLSRDDFLSNIKTLLLYAFENKINKIGQRTNREEWDVSSMTVNAFYSPSKNAIIFPAVYLQSPHFNGPNVHPARNFGAIGSIIGHELTHGFDLSGRKYDGDGNIHDWWDVSTSQAYKTRVDMIKTQYSRFEVHGEQGWLGNVTSYLTSREDIADNGGVALAWDAYRQYMNNIGSTTTGPETKEGDQMFFVAYAQTRCSVASDKTKRYLLHTDSHSPDEWRVNGVVMNNENFAKTFECDADTRMNPHPKLTLW